jgi:hypothetical protein
MNDLRKFVSPLAGTGTAHFKNYCTNNGIDADEWIPKLSAWFATFPDMIHVQAVERHIMMSWAEWMFLCPKG